eukprot:TRINITY_DN1493_c6_g1_i1.p1 TRINITY_DN1493_c6_g1~~TRINITY_DN1493_c6_g1_i1.p1  ORF type:complete len:486 (+),score=76.73 TRINITY_DN1493_c6_g1_i1:116-1573(+)
MGCAESKAPSPSSTAKSSKKPVKMAAKKQAPSENKDAESIATVPVAEDSTPARGGGRLSDMRSAAQSTPPTMFSVSPSVGSPPQSWGAAGRSESRANVEAIAQITSSPRSRRKSSCFSIASQEDLDNIRMEHTEEADTSDFGENPQREHRRTRKIDSTFSNSGFMLSPPLTPSLKFKFPKCTSLWDEAVSLHEKESLQQAEIKWRMCLSNVHGDDADSDRVSVFIKCNLAAVLSDSGKPDEAVDLLRSCVNANEEINSPDPRDYIPHYNLSLGLRDTRFIGKTEVEGHTRKAAEGTIRDLGLRSAVSLTALSELALVVFEQARIIEAYLLAKKSINTMISIHGLGHPEVTLISDRLQEVFEVDRWYSDECPHNDEEILMLKGHDEPMGAQWFGSRLEAVGDGKAADKAGLKSMIGRCLRTINGISVNSAEHMRELIKSTAIVVLWFDEPVQTDMLSEASLGRIPHALSVFSDGSVTPGTSTYYKE